MTADDKCERASVIGILLNRHEFIMLMTVMTAKYGKEDREEQQAHHRAYMFYLLRLSLLSFRHTHRSVCPCPGCGHRLDKRCPGEPPHT
jgi:hypothetical protein